MMIFKSLSPREQESLLKFPAYISLLAANIDGRFDEAEELSAVEFNHVKTYSCDPLLVDFFREADKKFKTTIALLNRALPLGKVNRDFAIKKNLVALEQIVRKLGPVYVSVMHRSMQSFKDHVSRAHHNALVDFIFPIPLKGLSFWSET